MADEREAWRRQLLRDALTALASEPNEQVRWIGSAHPDELALTFDDAYRLLPTLVAEGAQLSEIALATLKAIDEALDAMTGERNSELWTIEAIRTNRRWADLRTLAHEALAALPQWT
jgi:hypothetical protein